MAWVAIALLTAVFQSLKDVFSKYGLRRVDEYSIVWISSLCSILFLIPLVLYTGMPPRIGEPFWWALIISGSLNLVALVLYMKAYKFSDISITAPLLAFSPLFLLVTSPLTVGEFPNAIGLLGVLLIVFGSYMLHFNERKKGYFAPFKKLLSEDGPKYMLGVAFLWSISANFDKIGVLNSSAHFWVLVVNLYIFLFLTPILFYKSHKHIPLILPNLKALVPIGFFYTLSYLFNAIAFQLTLVAYAISIKRTSALFSILLGHFIFREKGIRQRMVGAIIMIVGVLFITLSS